jgi:DNA-binding response OmpR family regulator
MLAHHIFYTTKLHFWVDGAMDMTNQVMSSSKAFPIFKIFVSSFFVLTMSILSFVVICCYIINRSTALIQTFTPRLHARGAVHELNHYSPRYEPSYLVTRARTRSSQNSQRRTIPSTLFVSKNKDDNINNPQNEEVTRIKDKIFLERAKQWVIIVDDEEAIRLAVGDYLFDQGYKVTACADADAMLHVVSTPPSEESLPIVPDAIISDIRMPGKNGLQLLQIIRQDERLERVPVILLTAKAMTQDRIEGYRAGADAYLSKPFDPDELLSIVDNCISRRKQMTGEQAKLVELKQDMRDIKEILKKNGKNVVKSTDVYLTVAEREILDLLAKGYTNKEIAENRRTTPVVVGRSVQKMHDITDTRTRTELVRWALKTGYVNPRERNDTNGS